MLAVTLSPSVFSYATSHYLLFSLYFIRFFFALSTSFFVVFFCGTRFNTTFASHEANKVWSKLRNACFPFAPEPARHQAQPKRVKRLWGCLTTTSTATECGITRAFASPTAAHSAAVNYVGTRKPAVSGAQQQWQQNQNQKPELAANSVWVDTVCCLSTTWHVFWVKKMRQSVCVCVCVTSLTA